MKVNKALESQFNTQLQKANPAKKESVYSMVTCSNTGCKHNQNGRCISMSVELEFISDGLGGAKLMCKTYKNNYNRNIH